MPKDRKAPAKASAKAAKKQYTVEDLLAKATECYEDGKFELSSKFYVSALAKEPENSQIMDALADVYMQMGDVDNALLLLKKSTDLAPSDNPCKWMFLGQLQNCTEAVDSYRRGIDILKNNLVDPEFEVGTSVCFACELLILIMFRVLTMNFVSKLLRLIVAL